MTKKNIRKMQRYNMIDTIASKLDRDDYVVYYPDRFHHKYDPINFKDLDQPTKFIRDFHGVRNYIQSPPWGYREEGQVHPYVEITERYNDRFHKYTCDLASMVSAPKMIFDENISEVAEKDSLEFFKVLPTRLSNMGIEIKDGVIENAVVTRIDFCKNILFPSMVEARMFLDRLSKCSYPYLESSNTRYQNDGKGVHFWSNIFEINCYLKYFDILEYKNRAIDKHRTLKERLIAEKLEKEGNIPPLVRLEIRCKGIKSVRSHIREAVGIDQTEWTLKQVFNDGLCKNVINHFGTKLVEDEVNKAILTQPSDEDGCRLIVDKFGGKRPKIAIEGFGLFQIAKILGVRQLEQIFYSKYANDTWYEKRKKIIEYTQSYFTQDSSLVDVFSQAIKKDIPSGGVAIYD